MPQPKSSRSSTSRTSSSRARKPAAKPAASRRATTKRATTTRAAAKPSAAAAKTDEAAHANLRTLRDMLRRGAVVSQDHVKDALDDAVKKGRLSRKDATELSRKIMATGRKQADGFRSDLDRLVGRGRSRAVKSSDRVLRQVDRARRGAGVGSSFPISMYDELTAAQVQSRLRDLSPAELRKVRDYEKRHANRKSVLSGIEKKLK
jgi:polyhydroxyalkanoate synthesis regulator phasin